MDSYNRAREVEKPKTLTEKRALLKLQALNEADNLVRLAESIEVMLGKCPLAAELRAAATFVRQLEAAVR